MENLKMENLHPRRERRKRSMVCSLYSAKPSLYKHSGIDSAKWHVKKKVSPQARLAISKSHEERDFVKREGTFTLYRDDLCVEFR